MILVEKRAVFGAPCAEDGKTTCRSTPLFLVGEGGFEPPKSSTTDLQSAPFGHSGIPPYSNVFHIRPRGANQRSVCDAKRKKEGADMELCAPAGSGMERASSDAGAGRRTRTPDLLITNQLLYRLSYTSTSDAVTSATVIITNLAGFVNG